MTRLKEPVSRATLVRNRYCRAAIQTFGAGLVEKWNAVNSRLQLRYGWNQNGSPPVQKQPTKRNERCSKINCRVIFVFSSSAWDCEQASKKSSIALSRQRATVYNGK